MQRSNSETSYRLRIVVVVLVAIAGPWSVAQAQPAARVGDYHSCPLFSEVPPMPHIGGPILAPGVATVLIGGMPAAVVGTLAQCNGPVDTIVVGAPTVLINGAPAARLGDMSAHGGRIEIGEPTVLIGSSKVGSADLEGQAEVLEGLLEELGEDEGIFRALNVVYTLIGDQHAKAGNDGAAGDAYAKAQALTNRTATR